MGLNTRALFVALLAVVGLIRLVELAVSARHRRVLLRHGARAVPDPHFPWMVLLHVGVLVGAAVEVVLMNRPLRIAIAIPAGTVFVLANALRWWAIRSLGTQWTVTVMDAGRFGIVTTGPYRFVRHPNYVAVFAELAALPLIHTAWVTAVVGSAAHLWILSKRIALEERVLRDTGVYDRAIGRRPRFVPRLLAAIVASAGIVSTGFGEPVAVRHAEGLVHGFLSLRTLDGTLLADGDLLQNARGARVTSRLVFHFKDGSVHDETAVFSQRRQFRLLTDHLLQRGPAFPQPIDMTIDGMTGDVTVRYDDHGETKTASEHMDLPPDLANGLILTMLKNANPGAPPKSVGFVAATPKPRLVKLAISAAGKEPFSTGGTARSATHYVLKINIGGIAGVVAPLVGKQPPDSHVWILGGEAPAFVKSEQPLYNEGPVWRIELVNPVWRKQR